MKESKKEKNLKKSKYGREQIFIKIIAGVLALLMIGGTLVTIGFALLR